LAVFFGITVTFFTSSLFLLHFYYFLLAFQPVLVYHTDGMRWDSPDTAYIGTALSAGVTGAALPAREAAHH